MCGGGKASNVIATNNQFVMNEAMNSDPKTQTIAKCLEKKCKM